MRSVIVLSIDLPAEFGGCLAMTEDAALLTVSKHLPAEELSAVMSELLTPDVFGVHVTGLYCVA
jgi:hypothetical protein